MTDEKFPSTVPDIRNALSKFDDPITLTELYLKEFPKNQWTIQDLIPLNSVTVLSSPPGYYKTWVLLEFAIKLSLGLPIFGHFTAGFPRCGVIIVNEENWEGLIQARLKSLIALEDSHANVYFFNQKGFKLNHESTTFLITQCLDKNVKLIIFDSLIRMHNFDENDASKIKEVFDYLKRFTLAGISVLFTHHHRKQGMFKPANPSEQMRGSTDIAAMVDTHLLIDKKKITDDDFQEETILVMSQPKQRVRENLPDFKIFINHEEEHLRFIYGGEYDEENAKSAKANEFMKPVYEFVEQNPGCDKNVVIKAFVGKVGGRAVLEILKKLEANMEIVGAGRPKTYRVKPSSEGILNLDLGTQ